MIREFTAQSLLKKNLIIFTIASIWTPDNLSTTKTKLLQIYVIVLRFFILLPYISAQIINVCMVFRDLEKLTEAIFILTSVLLESLKSANFLLKQQNIKNLIKEFDSDSFNPRTDEEREIYLKTYTKCNKLFWFIFHMYNSTIFLLGLFPLLDTKQRSLPIPSWYPFETSKTPVYQFIYFHQCVITLFYTALDAAIDLTPIFLIVLISVRIDTLLQRVKGGYAGYMRDFQIHSNESEENKMKHLKQCAIEHEAIIQYVNKVNNIVSKVIIFQFVVSTLILCVTMFQMSVVEPGSLQFMSVFMYQICMVVQLFLYSWFGNEMTLKYSMIPEAAYFSDWYEQGTRYCKTLRFIMMRATEPIKITGGFLFIISLESFTAILKSSWSYFALLHQVHSEEE